MPSRSTRFFRGNRLAAAVMPLPAFALWVVLVGWPFLATLRLSMMASDAVTERFVGIGQLWSVVASSETLQAAGTSIIYAAVVTVLQTGMATILALFLTGFGKRVQAAVRFTWMIPMLCTGVIIGTLWRWVYHPRYGLANWLLSLVGIRPVEWMGGYWSSIAAVSIVLIMANVGISTLILSAALTAIPQEIIDAAKVDGCRPWQMRLRIMLPMCIATVSLNGLIIMIGTMQMWETLYMLVPTQKAANLMYDIWTSAFVYGRYGIGAAKTLVLIVLVILMTAGKQVLERR